MAYNFFRPIAGRFGTSSVLCASGQIGGANFLGGASPLTANTTTTFRLPTPPVKCRFVKMAASVVTVPLDNDGTILATARKYDNTNTSQALTASLDLEALTTRRQTAAGNLSSLTDANRIFNGTTDVLEIDVVNNSAAIDTQPAGLVFTALFELLA